MPGRFRFHLVNYFWVKSCVNPHSSRRQVSVYICFVMSFHFTCNVFFSPSSKMRKKNTKLGDEMTMSLVVYDAFSASRWEWLENLSCWIFFHFFLNIFWRGSTYIYWYKQSFEYSVRNQSPIDLYEVVKWKRISCFFSTEKKFCVCVPLIDQPKGERKIKVIEISGRTVWFST
jgi:hypothetical protein